MITIKTAKTAWIVESKTERPVVFTSFNSLVEHLEEEITQRVWNESTEEYILVPK